MQKSIQKFTMSITILVALILMIPEDALAQDATKVDPKHYSVEFENDEVRILRIKYGPGEKSVMHKHPRGVAFFVSDYEATFTLPDGSVVNVSGKGGSTIWTEEAQHLPENVGKHPMEVIQVEFKTKPKKKIKSKYNK
jgi:quercetin dioxygenase-like cupin family protein